MASLSTQEDELQTAVDDAELAAVQSEVKKERAELLARWARTSVFGGDCLLVT